MKDDSSDIPPAARGDWRSTVLAAAGLAAGFGAAACCVLPLGLAALGLGGAWFGMLALFFGPYRVPLIAAGLVCLGLALGRLYWPRPRRGCARPAGPALKAGLCLAAALLAAAALIA